MGERRGTKALELWCRRMTEGYPGVKIDNMTTSWRDGLAFCAMIHRFRPDLIEFDKLNKADVFYNNELAFTTAEKYLGIPALLDADDMAAYEVPDRLSILTYLSQFYQAFTAQDPANRLKRPSPATTEKSQMAKPPGPPPKMAHVVGVPRRDPCHKCQLPVFLAERLAVGKKIYHRTCLKCARCGSQLTPGSFYETEVDDEYCCETCPDEEDITSTGATAAAIGDSASVDERVLLRNATNDMSTDDLSATTTAAASAQARRVRSSIAERLAFFEKGKNGEVTPPNGANSKLLQKSVSDEEKTKSLQRMEEHAASPYKMNAALNSFLRDAVDGEKDEGNSEHSLTSESKTGTQMETTDSEGDEEEEENEVKNTAAIEQQPELPKTAPPILEEKDDVAAPSMPTPSKRFTSTAQLQLSNAQIETENKDTEQQQREDNEANCLQKPPTPEKRKTVADIRLNVTEDAKKSGTATSTTPPKSKNNNNTNNNIDLDETETETSKTQQPAPTILEENLEISKTNDNDCVTKEKFAERPTTTITTTKTISAAHHETSTPVEPAVELRSKPQERLQQQEDTATTERLSVVRARLQQFEVIANNNNFDRTSPEKDNITTKNKLDLEDKQITNNKEQKESAAKLQSDAIATGEPESKIENVDFKLEEEVMEIETEPETKAVEETHESLNDVPSNMEIKDINDSLVSKTDEEGEEKKEDEASQNMETENQVSVEKIENIEKSRKSIESSPAKIKSAEKSIVSSPAKTPKKITLEYPEELNPFSSDEEDDDDGANATTANKENLQTPNNLNTPQSRTSIKTAVSMNPFDSSDDEIELEKSRNSTASSTPSSSSKVPPPRPPPPRVTPRNPFGEEETDEDASLDTRQSSRTSSFTKKTPVPTPRTNLSQSQNPTPEPTPRLSNKALQGASTTDYYGSANSLNTSTTPSLQRNSDARGSNNSLTSSAGGTIRSRKARKAPAPPPPPVKELFPSSETVDSSKASTPSSSTVGSPKSGRKKRPAPAPPKPARLENIVTAPKNLLSYPLQSELDSKLSDEEKALLEGKQQSTVTVDNIDEVNKLPAVGKKRLIPLDASLLEDDDGDGTVHVVDEDGVVENMSKCDDLKERQRPTLKLQEEETNVVYRRMLIAPPLVTPTRESNPLVEFAHDRQLEKLKDNKEAKNRNRQSQLSGSSGAEDSDPTMLYNKSSHGKWKRRKGPAPALPIPPRKVLQMLPLQEIRHELEIIEVQQQGLEKQGVILEKMIRDRCEGQNGEPLGLASAAAGSADFAGSGDDGTDGKSKENVQNSKEVEDLILQLFELVNEKNELFRRQAELMYLRRQHRLEQEQADLEYEIRVLMAQPECNKTDTDKSREEALIARLVEVVQLRNEVVECLEMDRLREAEEDLSIKQRLELHNANREGTDEYKKSSAKLSKKEKKKQKEAKKLGKSKKLDADKDADESELSLDKQRGKKKKKLFKLLGA